MPHRTTINETKVENRIGDALFDRIMRADRDNTPWKCCIVIPLLPGFTFPVDHGDANAVSLTLPGLVTVVSVGIASHYTRLPKS
jgi:phospholipase D1/2